MNPTTVHGTVVGCVLCCYWMASYFFDNILGWKMCLVLKTSDLFQMLNTMSVMIRKFNNYWVLQHQFLMCTRWYCQCISKWQCAQISFHGLRVNFVFFSLPLQLWMPNCYHDSLNIQVNFSWVWFLLFPTTISVNFSWVWFLLFPTTISVLFHYDDYACYWYV